MTFVSERKFAQIGRFAQILRGHETDLSFCDHYGQLLSWILKFQNRENWIPGKVSKGKCTQSNKVSMIAKVVQQQMVTPASFKSLP